MIICWACNRQILPSERSELHHPDRSDRSRVVQVHAECHRRLHSESGDFSRWGRWGYEKVTEVTEDWHRLGGLARAAAAQRDRLGRFVGEA